MSHFAVIVLDSENEQIERDVRFSKSCTIQNIRIKILKHGVIADGSLSLKVYNSSSELLEEIEVSYSDLNSISGTYAHGFINFELTKPIVINMSKESIYTELSFNISMKDHTYDEDNYIGIILEENPYYSEFGDRPTSISSENDIWFNPIGIEIYSTIRN